MALSVTELQIGDWVLCHNPYQASDNYAKVIGICPAEGDIKPHTFIVRFRDDSILVDARESWVKPIPLTAEILEKNGWKEYPQVYSSQKTLNFDIYRFEDEVGIKIQGNCIVLNYVHELQRALRCCGLWDLANNFKIE